MFASSWKAHYAAEAAVSALQKRREVTRGGRKIKRDGRDDGDVAGGDDDGRDGAEHGWGVASALERRREGCRQAHAEEQREDIAKEARGGSEGERSRDAGVLARS